MDTPFFDPINRLWFDLFNADANTYPTLVATAVYIAEDLPVVMFCFLIGYLIDTRHRGKHLWIGTLAAVGLAVVAAYFLQKSIYYPRPFVMEVGTNFLPHSASSSFPGKHATPLFAAGIYLSLLRETRLTAICWLLLSCTVAWARIFLGVQWPPDMAVSLVVGGSAAASAYAATARLRQHKKAAKQPQ